MTFFEVYCFGDDGVFCYGCSHQSQLFKVIRNQGKCKAFPNDFMVCYFYNINNYLAQVLSPLLSVSLFIFVLSFVEHSFFSQFSAISFTSYSIVLGVWRQSQDSY